MAIETIVNGTTIIVQENVDYSWLGVLIASIVALITLFGIVLTNRRMKESNNELRKSNNLIEQELKLRLRPLLELPHSLSSIQGKENDYHLKLYYTIKNSGTVTARNITRRSFLSNNDGINNIVKELDKIEKAYEPIGIIKQGDSKSLTDDKIPLHDDVHKPNWIVWLEYEYLGIKEKTVIVFPHLTAGQEPVSHYWFDHEEVIKAEKRRDDERAGSISAQI